MFEEYDTENVGAIPTTTMSTILRENGYDLSKPHARALLAWRLWNVGMLSERLRRFPENAWSSVSRGPSQCSQQIATESRCIFWRRVDGLLLSAWGASVVQAREEMEWMVDSMERLCSTDEQDRGMCEEGFVYIDEFVASLMDLQEIQRNERWKDAAMAAFQKLDTSNSGALEMNQLLEQVCVIDEELEECSAEMSLALKQAHIEDNGKIDFQNFLDLLQASPGGDNLSMYEKRYDGAVPASWEDAY
ncbi:hypothetical protein CYMTET_34984 [Cymbomonas tetramitiformis]|uniref:Uncharacterized protein n=1 Tax=Cymbomonas tetramitiformis TaxID=36881 RepID=A0AAE0KPF3_9CHLO|nr:hypothetical protein CYMTET_34984 [Cymbomonas tetramitiformis]